MAEKMKSTGQLSIHTENIFPIIKKWLYSEHDIFVRELISNSMDALQKRKTMDESVKEEDLRVEIKISKKKKMIEFIDYGIGMTKSEIDRFINQIAFSGAEEFIEEYKDKQSNIIGHFGLGFYSSFMVANKVTIDSKSYRKGTKPAFWECDGTTSYTLADGSRKEPGTTVTVYLNDDSSEYLDYSKLRELIEKYSNFVPFPVELEKKVVNQREALWNRKPNEVKEEEYREFYKSVFQDYQDPLFWIHLNVDYPFALKGILYFPKIRSQLELQRGKVKLYCNNVFVADNLSEFIPEFLLMLKGGIDIPEIPLNVSRSFLQQDQNVKKISKYIIKKVADYLNELFKEDREKYEKYWEDIHQFIKYGALTEETFYEAVKDIIIFKTISGNYTTIAEYKERNKTDKKPQKVYYAAGKDTQVSYLNMMKEAGKEVLVADNLIDNHLFQQFEMKDQDLVFARIDSELDEEFVDKERQELVDSDEKTELDRIKEVFDKGLDDKEIKVQVKRLKNKDIPGLVVFNEFMRRMQDMQNIVASSESSFLQSHDFIVNAENPNVKKILKLQAKGKEEEVKLLCQYLHSLSLMEQKQFSGEDLSRFIEKTHKVLEMI